MSLAVKGYVKQFYKGNTFGATENGRHGQGAYTLMSADLKAMRRAIQGLGDYDYDDGEGGELINKVQAFVTTYNNYIDSAKGMEDGNVDRYLSKLKKLTKENADKLSEIGVTIQSSGKLKVDKETLQDTNKYQVSKLFSTDAEYGKGVEKQMKLTNRMMLRNNLNIPKKSTKKETPSDNTTAGIRAAMAEENVQLAQQLTEVLSGSHLDYTV